MIGIGHLESLFHIPPHPMLLEESVDDEDEEQKDHHQENGPGTATDVGIERHAALWLRYGWTNKE